MKSKKVIRGLVMGKAASGKTTLINMIANLMLNKTYSDPRSIAISTQGQISDSNGEDKTYRLDSNMPQFSNKQSEYFSPDGVSYWTTECNIFEFENDSLKLILMDTPGIGDILLDQRNLSKFMLALKQLGSFETIILVQKGCDCRKDPLFMYALTHIKGLLTNDCKSNVVVCYTAVSNPAKIDAKNALSKVGFSCFQYFAFENCCFIPSKLMQNFLTEDEFEDFQSFQNEYWNKNRKEFSNLLNTISQFPTRDADIIVNLYNNRRILESILDTLPVKSEKGLMETFTQLFAEGLKKWIIMNSMHPVNEYLEAYIDDLTDFRRQNGDPESISSLKLLKQNWRARMARWNQLQGSLNA